MSEADRINPTNATSPAIASLRSDCNAASIINLKEMSADLPPLDPTSIRGSGRVANASATDAAANASADATSPATDAAASGDADGAAIGGATASEGPIMEPDSDERVWRKVPLAQGDSDPHVWRKVLYLRQPFDDTHTDPRTFLADMRTNAGVVKPRYWSLVRDSSVLTLQMFLVSALVVVYFFLDSHRLSARTLFLLDSLSLAAGVLLSSLASLRLQRHKRLQHHLKGQQQQQQQQPHASAPQSTPPPSSTPPSPSLSLPPPTLLDLLSASRLPRLIVDCSIFVFGLYLLSPILHTLTQSISSDTVASCTTLLFLLHLFFHDYNYSTAATLSFSGNLSLMSAIYASVLLASRLSTTAQVYAFMWLALSVFSLLPSLLHHWRRANPQTHRVLVWGMKAVALAVLMAWHKGFAVVVVVAAAAVTYVFPLLFVYMHKEKQFIKGPWDEAQPGTSSS